MRKIVFGLALMSAPMLAVADSGPGCGLGAEMWKGQSGLVAHTSAGTTNGTFSSPLSGILSGTSGCENPDMVSNEYQKKIFVALNLDDLAQDIAQGRGDHLTSMASLMGIEPSDHATFFQLTQANYDSIFKSSSSNYEDVLVAVNDVMLTNNRLSHYVQ